MSLLPALCPSPPSSNPIYADEGEPAEGFEPTNPNQLPRRLFAGLRKGSSDKTCLQGDARDAPFWFMAVGAFTAFNGGIPGLAEPLVTVDFVQLYVDPAAAGERLKEEDEEEMNEENEVEATD